MNVSGISAYSPSFGQIKKSAVEKAINIFGYNPDQVQEMVEQQRGNNRYDIIGLGPGESYNFEVVGHDDKKHVAYDYFLETACMKADELAAHDATIESVLTCCPGDEEQ